MNASIKLVLVFGSFLASPIADANPSDWMKCQTKNGKFGLEIGTNSAGETDHISVLVEIISETDGRSSLYPAPVKKSEFDKMARNGKYRIIFGNESKKERAGSTHGVPLLILKKGGIGKEFLGSFKRKGKTVTLKCEELEH